MTVGIIQQAIEKLEAIDPSLPTAYDDAIKIYKEIGRMPFLIANTAEPVTAFRTRTHDNDILFEDFSEISIPAPMYVKNFGRCNIPGQSVFYCSDFRPTSYMELLQYWIEEKTNNPILHATISKWNFKKPVRLLIVTSPNPQDRIWHYDIQQGKILDEFLDQFNEEAKKAMILFYQYLFKKFRKPAKHDVKTYIITSAYSNLAFNTGQVDAIYYPSVPYDGRGVNLAIYGGFDFKNMASIELVARDTFERNDTAQPPSFKQINFQQAASIDATKNRIVWA